MGTQSLCCQPRSPLEEVARFPLSTYAVCQELLLLWQKTRASALLLRMSQRPGLTLLFPRQPALCAPRPVRVSTPQMYTEGCFLEMIP